MKMTVEIDSKDLITFDEMAQILAEREMVSLDEVNLKTGEARFSRKEDSEYGRSEYLVDLNNGYTRGRDNPLSDWEDEEDFECPIGDKDWNELVFVKDKKGQTFLVDV